MKKNISDKRDSKIVIDNQLNILKKLSYVAIKSIKNQGKVSPRPVQS